MEIKRANSREAIHARLAAGRISRTWPALLLPSRLALFAFWQAVFALIFVLRDAAAPWETSIPWWPFNVTLTNLVSVFLLIALARREGMRYRDYLNFDRSTFWRDLLLSLGILVASAPLAYLPNVLLANALFGDAQQAFDLMFRPLPIWAAWLSVALFPLTIALAELPNYYGYCLPRLAVLSGRGSLAIIITSFFLSIQHATLPLIFDWRFILWRGLMFGPFALFLAIVLYWRPRLLAYLMAGHVLIDLLAALPLLTISL